jgi:hypothetical protein
VTVFLAWYKTDEQKLLKWKRRLKTVTGRRFQIVSSHDILPGRKWAHDLEQKIRQSDIFAPFLSLCACYAYYNEDTFLRREIEIALQIAADAADPRSSYFVAPAYLEDPIGFSRLRDLRDFNDIQLFNPRLGRRQLIEAVINTKRKLPARIKQMILKRARL